MALTKGLVCFFTINFMLVSTPKHAQGRHSGGIFHNANGQWRTWVRNLNPKQPGGMFVNRNNQARAWFNRLFFKNNWRGEKRNLGFTTMRPYATRIEQPTTNRLGNKLPNNHIGTYAQKHLNQLSQMTPGQIAENIRSLESSYIEQKNRAQNSPGVGFESMVIPKKLMLDAAMAFQAGDMDRAVRIWTTADQLMNSKRTTVLQGYANF